MAVAAVPEYLGNDFSSASPALRFGMYLRAWESRSWSKQKASAEALRRATTLTDNDSQSIKAHVQRQQAIFDVAAGEHGLALIAKSVSPFTTGLGNEHPLENGFAFLSPYGVPYLPGSGVKGVVRRAAEELAHPDFFQDRNDWTLPAIWHLFGFEPWLAVRRPDAELDRWIDGFSASVEEVGTYLDMVLEDTRNLEHLKDRVLRAGNPTRELLQERNLHVRGALEFWDVVPRVSSQNLTVEIMTPHQSHYYRDKPHAKSTSPHDSGRPNPILFMTVPPGSDFAFHVRCDYQCLSRRAPELATDGRWRTLLQAAFGHAFEWLGFGAKTAVGYGAMERDLEGEARSRQEREDNRRAAHERAEKDQAEHEAKVREEERLASLSPLEREIEAVVRDGREKNLSETVAVMHAVRGGRWSGHDKVQAARWLQDQMKAAKGWREVSAKKRPDKDKDYQNTLQVKAWLEGG